MPWVERVKPNWEHWDLMSWLGRPMPDAVLKPLEVEPETFAVRFLEDLLARAGESADIITHLAYLYTHVGRHRDALVLDQRLVVLRPRDPLAFYNLACSYSLLKQVGRAFAALKKAIELGYRDIQHMQEDKDLENLRLDPRWNDLLNVIRL